MTDTVLCVVIGTLLFRLWHQHRHLHHLRHHPAPHGIDTWDLHCRACRKPVRASRVYIALAHAATDDADAPGMHAHLVRVRVWHADRPRCMSHYLTDPDVMEHQLKGGQP